jgi:hypothetical protein
MAMARDPPAHEQRRVVWWGPRDTCRDGLLGVMVCVRLPVSRFLPATVATGHGHGRAILLSQLVAGQIDRFTDPNSEISCCLDSGICTTY